MTNHEATGLIALLAAGYRVQQKITAETIAAYVSAINDLDYATARVAVERLRRVGGNFFPSIPEIREAVRLETAPPQLSPPEAWEKALTWAKKGSYGPPPPRDELWGRACYAVGLGRLCTEPLRFIQPQFLTMYRELAASHTERDRRHALPDHTPDRLLTMVSALTARHQVTA